MYESIGSLDVFVRIYSVFFFSSSSFSSYPVFVLPSLFRFNATIQSTLVLVLFFFYFISFLFLLFTLFLFHSRFRWDFFCRLSALLHPNNDFFSPSSRTTISTCVFVLKTQRHYIMMRLRMLFGFSYNKKSIYKKKCFFPSPSSFYIFWNICEFLAVAKQNVIVVFFFFLFLWFLLFATNHLQHTTLLHIRIKWTEILMPP